MPKPPRNWPIGALPGRMDAKCAAYYAGVSVTTFLEGVAIGKYPQPVRERSRKLWRTSELKAVIDPAPDSPQPDSLSDDEWLGELDRADANPRH